MTDSSRREDRFGIIAAAIVASLLLYWPSLEALSNVWLDSARTTYTHGYLVAGICLWLLWGARSRMTEARARTGTATQRAAGLMTLVGLVICWQLVYRAGIQTAYLGLLPLLLWCGVLVIMGVGVARVCAFPFAMIYFAIPIWDYINPLAQWSTVYAVRAMLSITGIPVLFSANTVQIPDGTFEIEGGCSGLHFIIVALSIAALSGELRRDGFRNRLRLMLIALALAILTNWVRVFTIIVAGHITHMQSYLVRVSHYGYGWCLFALALGAFFLLERRLPLRESGAPDSAPRSRLASKSTSVWVATGLLVMALPAGFNALIDARSHPLAVTVSPPSGWQAVGTVADWRPVQVMADAEQLTRFQRGDLTVDAYVATYLSQGERKKLGGFDNGLNGNDDILEEGVADVPPLTFRTMEVSKRGGDRAVIWYRYVVGGHTYESATRAQLYYSGHTLLSLRSLPAQVLAMRARCAADCASARAALRSFASGAHS